MKTKQRGAPASIERVAWIQMCVGAVLRVAWLVMRGGESNHDALFALGAGFFIAGSFDLTRCQPRDREWKNHRSKPASGVLSPRPPPSSAPTLVRAV